MWKLLFVFTVAFSTRFGYSDSDSTSQLLDSLYITSDEEQLGAKELSTSPSSPVPSNELIRQSKLNSPIDTSRINVERKFPKPRSRNWDYLDQGQCPSVRCFTFRNTSTRKVVLDCQDRIPRTIKILQHINCSYWKNPTTWNSFRGEVIKGPAVAEGRGYDLKVILGPDQTDANQRSVVHRLHIDHLVPGILGWIIQTVRARLRMDLSPVHLTISYIYVATLRRIDLGDLSTRSHVTRLSIWNPFNWEDDSFMPLQAENTAENYVYTQDSLLPPYFRLTVFCDLTNRISAFRRLWLPWKSWQVRFNHCHDQYECRSWISKYPICDATGSNKFMPTYFLLPQPVIATPSTSLAYASVNKRNNVGNQVLFESTCQREAGLWDPVDDLKLDHQKQCWQPNVYNMDKNHASLDSVVIIPEKELNIEPEKSVRRPPSTTTTTTTWLRTTTATTIRPVLKTKFEPSFLPVTQATASPSPTERPPNRTSSKLIKPAGIKPYNDTNQLDAVVPLSNTDLLQYPMKNSYPSHTRSISESPLIYVIITLVILILFLISALVFAIICIKRRTNQQQQQQKLSNGFLSHCNEANSQPLLSTSMMDGIQNSIGANSPATYLPRTRSELFTSTLETFVGMGKTRDSRSPEMGNKRTWEMSNQYLNSTAKTDQQKPPAVPPRIKSHHFSQLSMNSFPKHLGQSAIPAGYEEDSSAWHGPRANELPPIPPRRSNKRRKLLAFWKPPSKPHTMVFEEGDLTKENWPESLDRSFSRIS